MDRDSHHSEVGASATRRLIITRLSLVLLAGLYFAHTAAGALQPSAPRSGITLVLGWGFTFLVFGAVVFVASRLPRKAPTIATFLLLVFLAMQALATFAVFMHFSSTPLPLSVVVIDILFVLDLVVSFVLVTQHLLDHARHQ